MPLLAVLLALGGCGGGRHGSAALTPMPLPGAGPDDRALAAAVKTYLAQTGTPAYTHYSYARLDLNSDGLQDGIVYIDGPYGYWCGDEGCALLVLRAAGDGFVPVSLIRRVRNPIHVSRTVHSGWHDLAVRVAAGEEKAEYVLLRHDGRGYPDPPALAGQGVLFYPEMSLRRLFP